MPEQVSSGIDRREGNVAGVARILVSTLVVLSAAHVARAEEKVHVVKASSFADPADVAVYKKCLRSGRTALQCVGDNGIGLWRDDTTVAKPMCALPRDVWLAKWKTKSQSLLVIGSRAPTLIAASGARAETRFLEFFAANIRNKNTRRAYLHAYIDGCGLAGDPKGPLFRTIGRGTGKLTSTPLPQRNAYEMIRRRAGGADIATKIGNHTFRATGITAYLKNGGTLERAAIMANHASTRTTQLYDRRRDDVSLDEVERILI
jgi:hypothetical protein